MIYVTIVSHFKTQIKQGLRLRSVISQNISNTEIYDHIYCAWPRQLVLFYFRSTLLSCDEYRWRLLYSGIRTWNNVPKVPDHDRQPWLIDFPCFQSVDHISNFLPIFDRCYLSCYLWVKVLFRHWVDSPEEYCSQFTHKFWVLRKLFGTDFE